MEKKIVFSTRWYESRVHHGVLKYAQSRHWDVISSHHMHEVAFAAPNADGQIVEIGVRDRRRLRLIREYKGPVVGLEDLGDGLEIPRVHMDNCSAGRLAARHLLDRGFTTFATLSRLKHQYAQNRVKGFRQEVETAEGCSIAEFRCDGLWAHVGSNKSDRLWAQIDAGTNGQILQAMRNLLELPRPVGVFCVDDEDAAALIRFLESQQIHVPEEFAVVGVNNDPIVCPYARIPITSVDPDFEAIGFKAAELLDEMMQGKKIPAKTYTVPAKEVVVRRSSDILAVEDLLVARALRFIWDRSESWISIGDIAAHVETPVRTLQWRFSKAMGQTLQDEMTRSRIEVVKERLLNTDKSAQKIAEEMNFSSVQYMNRQFSKETGISPLKFRKSRQAS